MRQNDSRGDLWQADRMAQTKVQTAQQTKWALTAPQVRRRKRRTALLQSPLALFGVIVLLAVTLSALLAPVIAPFDPLQMNIPKRLAAPSFSLAPGTYLLGTDSLGRDILSRIMYGARVSLVVGLSSVVAAGSFGVAFGLIAGYFGRWFDHILMRLVDIWMAVPFLALAIAIVAVLGPSLENIILVLALTGWVTYSRVVRGQVLSIRERTYIESARAVGASDLRIMFRHILPNVSTSIIVVATLQVAQMITTEAALSFLGIGVQPPTPAWGSMVAEGKDVIAVAWWLSAFPGLVILVTVLGINLLGDWLRDVLDPQLRI